MPNFRVHTTINLLALGGLAYTATARLEIDPPLIWLSAASFAIATFLLSPDLDLRRSSPTRNWGVLRWIWLPYQALFKHRGMSHSLLLSSLTRLGYLGCLAVGAIVVFHSWANPSPASIAASVSMVPQPTRAIVTAYSAQLAAGGIGIALSDLCHIITDRVVSALRAIAKI